MPTQIDLTFPHAYEVEELHDLPGGAPARLFYMPSGSQTSGRDGICLKISPAKAPPWIGMFAFNMFRDDQMISMVYSCPDGESLCVVSRGEGYIVRADDPTKCEKVPALPIRAVRVVEEAGLILFWDFTAIAAWGSAGLTWRTERVCWDDLQVEEITPAVIRGTGWNPADNNRSSFQVDSRTGKIISRTGTGPF